MQVLLFKNQKQEKALFMAVSTSSCSDLLFLMFSRRSFGKTHPYNPAKSTALNVHIAKI